MKLLIFVYDFVQFLGVMILVPGLLRRRGLRGTLEFLGFGLPITAKKKEGRSILVYAVSVGEVRAFASLYKQMKVQYSEDSLHIACRTKTGYEEAKRSCPDAAGYFLLPCDLSWVIGRFLDKLSVDVLMLVESDFWYNLLRLAKKRGAKVFLISGRISERSYRRFLKFPFFSKRLFFLFDGICAQNALFKERFAALGAHPDQIFVTGNIKLAAQPSLLSEEEKRSLRTLLGIQEGDVVVVAGSTHFPEERELIRQFYEIRAEYPRCKLILVPRHLENLGKIKEVLQTVPYIIYSQIDQKTGQEDVILMDVMGKLFFLYQIGDIAIVAGSFLPHLEGHNILEPIQAGIPVFFGPYMSSQKDLVELVLLKQAGEQVSLEQLSSVLLSFLKAPQALRSKADAFSCQMRLSVSDETLQKLNFANS